jgi:hypothetical protein
MKYGPSKSHSRHRALTATPSADQLAASNQSPPFRTFNYVRSRCPTIIDR